MIDNKFTYISLFSSAGVGCYGFKEEGFECIVTNEIIEKRLNIQKLNNKCKYNSGYISGDIRDIDIQDRIYLEINKWKQDGMDRVDVVIATPPCQGMSVANHKKKEDEIVRNSLIVESVKIVKEINPRIFVFENVAAFWKTGCIDSDNKIISIGDMITKELGSRYIFHNEVINFKNYGSNSSRTRTLVIGVDKEICNQISPLELFPDYQEEKKLIDVIGDMKSLEWGEYDENDFYHSFRTYPLHMREWIKDVKQGESAFDNKEDWKKPHKIINGEIVINKSKNADKYTRQIYEKVAPCIHTRNDQMASQNTVHPIDDRVFSIRELMRIMTIPNSFKWIDKSISELNSLTPEEKRKLSKAEEMNIRRSIGEAVPTDIFRQIANKIKVKLSEKNLSEAEILKIIKENKLENFENLVEYVKNNMTILSNASITSIIELSNTKRESNSAYYTNKYIIQEIQSYLPDFQKSEISIIEPSVGAGNFLPFIFKKYEKIEKVKLTVVDIDSNIIELLKIIYSDDRIPKNFEIEFICADFLKLEHKKVDLIIGNPPFTKLNSSQKKEYLDKNYNKKSTNLAEFILEKSINMADYVSLIMPKNLLNTSEYEDTRKILNELCIDCIIDLGEKGFKGVLVETINIIINTNEKSKITKVISLTNKLNLIQKSSYIFDSQLPYWVIYRDEFFDNITKKMNFNIFDVFRDRQLTNSNTYNEIKSKSSIRVIKSRNISDKGDCIIDIDGYDAYVDIDTLKNLSVYRFLDNDNIYMTPNMTYNPRLMKKNKGYVVNGSVALMIPKDDIELTKEQMEYISSEEFRRFYKIARNYQTRSLNVDKTSCYWFGINKEL